MIDKDEAIRLLRKEVANKGADFVYEPVVLGIRGERCLYFRDGQPSCVVGHALYSADESYKDTIGEKLFSADQLSEYGDISNEASWIFRAAQSAQDEGQTWGDALAAAEWEYRVSGGTE